MTIRKVPRRGLLRAPARLHQVQGGGREGASHVAHLLRRWERLHVLVDAVPRLPRTCPQVGLPPPGPQPQIQRLSWQLDRWIK
eukprot:8659681-Pyramimonas_sp.AAC.1